MNAITWDMIRGFLDDRYPKCFTNKQISKALDCDYSNVSYITCLMFRAGEIDRLIQGNAGTGPHLYFSLRKGAELPIANMFRDMITGHNV